MSLPLYYERAEFLADGGRNYDGHGWGPFLESDQPWCVVMHTTETAGIPGYRTQYGGVHPHFTYYARERRWVQHNRLNRRAGTLRGSSTTEGGKQVPTNAAKAIQVEIIAYSQGSVVDRYPNTGRIKVSELSTEQKQDIADFLVWCNEQYEVPLIWYPKPRPSGTHPMSHRSWWHDRAGADWGVCEHATAPDNSTHWDCGPIDSAGVMVLANTGTGPTPEPPDPGDEEVITALPTLKVAGPPYSEDPFVQRMQACLNILNLIVRDSTNWNDETKKWDGMFGPSTASAVRKAQRLGNLTVDGVCGSATWAFILGVGE